jgi:hypothetical protein
MFRAERIDDGRSVEGYYFKTPLTGETFTDSFSSGVNRHCIATDESADFEGVVYEIKPETLKQFVFGSWRLVSELEKPKRKPPADGTLSLTEGELEELKNIWIPNKFADIKYVKKITNELGSVLLMVFCVNGENRGKVFGESVIKDVEAIAYLLNRFNLTEGKYK